MLGGPVKIGSASALSSPLGFFAGRRPRQLRQHLASKQLRQHLRAPHPPACMGLAVGLHGGGRSMGGLVSAPVVLALRFLASPGPRGLFYSIGSTVTLGLDDLFFSVGSRGLSTSASLDGSPVGSGLGLLDGQPVGSNLGVLVGPSVVRLCSCRSSGGSLMCRGGAAVGSSSSSSSSSLLAKSSSLARENSSPVPDEPSSSTVSTTMVGRGGVPPP